MADNPQPISLDPYNQAEGNLINLGQITPTVSPDTAADRSAKMKFGLGTILGDNYKDTYSDILSGREDSIRREASADLDAKNAKSKQDAIQDLSSRGLLDDQTFSQLNLKPVNPDSVMEEAFAHTWMHGMQSAGINMGSTFMKDSPPEQVQAVSDIGSELITKHQMMSTWAQKLQDQVNSETGWDKAGNYLKGFIPFYNEYKLRGNVDDVGEFAGGPLGENLEQQAQHLLMEPLDDFSRDFPHIMQSLSDSDPALAMQFLSALHGQTTKEKFTQDAFSVANVASLLPIGTVADAALSGAAKDMTESAFTSQFSREGIIPSSRALVVTSNIPARAVNAEAAGDLQSAAALRVSQFVEEDLKGKANPTARAIERLQDVLNLDKQGVGSSPGSMSREQVNRIMDQYDAFMGRFTDLILGTMRTMRIPLDRAAPATIKAIQDSLKDKFPGLSNRIFNITNPIYEPVSNTWFMGMDIGQVDGSLFKSEKQAQIAANWNDLRGYEIRQQGLGYHLRVYKSIDEDTDIMRNFLSETGLSNNKSFKNAVLGWFRSPDDTFGKAEAISRKTAQYPQAKFREFAMQESQAIKDLLQGKVRTDPLTGEPLNKLRVNARSWLKTWSSRQTWNEFKRVLDQSRNLGDVASKKMGYTFKSPQELSHFYLSTIGREPSYAETEAYFAKSRLDLLDWFSRNSRVYTNKARLGTETWRVFIGDQDGKPTFSNYFDGISQPGMPGGDFGIALIDGQIGKERFFPSGSFMQSEGGLGSQAYNDIRDGVMKGEYKVIELWAPEWRPLEGYGKLEKQRIRYVITRNAENHPLTWEQVPRRGGGHFDYDYDYYLKQANMKASGGEHWYEGDTTIAALPIRSLGEDAAKHLNEVRLMLREGQTDAARRYTQDHLPMDFDDIKGWFESGRLGYEEPIRVIEKDQLIGNVDNDRLQKQWKNFRNGVKQGSKNSQYQVEYTGERDNQGLYAINDKGTRNNPLYNWEPAAMVDPITTLNRGLNRIVNSTFMDDYKMSAMQRFMIEAEPYLIDSPEEKRSSPYFYFSRLPSMFRADVPYEVKQNLTRNWQKIQQFIGQPSQFDTMLHRAEQLLQDWTYDTLGPKGAVAPTWLLHHVKDPVQWVRKLTYDAKLGLFNPGQWLLQNQAWTNIWAISPRSAPAGSIGMFFSRWADRNMDEAFLDKIDAMAAKLKLPGFHVWKPGELKESIKTLKTTNFAHVGGEYASLDIPNAYKFISGRMSDFLDFSHVFFRDGVYTMRLGAWHAAFKEFRQEHPTGKLGPSDVADILNKADMYHANMTRASSTQMSRGVLSLPLQFQTYFLGLTNLFLGKRLGATTGERALARFRLGAFYSALYGIPAAVGLTGLPLGSYWKKTAQEHGYVPGDNWWTTLMNEGIPSMMTNLALGRFYNIGDRYGTPGLDFLKDALQADQPWWTVMGGASLETAWPFVSSWGHIIWGMTDSTYKLTMSDWLQPWKQITSVNKGWQFFMAAKYHEWLSANEGLLQTGVSIPEAFGLAMTGLQTDETSSMFTKSESYKERLAFDKNNLQQYLLHMGRLFRAGKDNNQSLWESEYKNAAIYLSLLPPDKQNQAQSIAARRNSTIAGSINYNFYNKDVPPGWQQEYQRIFNELYQHEHENK